MSSPSMSAPERLGPPRGARIEVSDVYQYFASPGKEPVLAVDTTSLVIEPGEFVCFVGPSGCGKTTVLNQIAGLVKPTGGTVTLDGKTAKEGRPDVGYLLARDGLLPWRTALGNVMLPMELRGTPRAEAEHRAAGMLETVGLGKFLHSYPSQLSHGMRQRTALSRTLVVEPTTILMDEPFSALDAETRLRLQGVFLKLWEHHRSSVCFVTHDLSEAIVMADRILVFGARPGKIIADYRINLERPRNVLELQENDQYHHYFQEIWSVLRKELAAA
ncbi:ABC transporter ATP-binding protein [Arthrobacter sp. I2-34]|uniref:ABC transporter ATP-binding protein n=1 Tax=Arthrobacter hankyongi TaxID=2904801 RepID=A0ABS9LDH8_9MICC|nr:ABC transporter ATP-binding protein [Arthrobacter hankyongi]MCG2624716.1 ABC transporter ATP-binding protein [Arthrobacter hankyongi]